MMILLGFLGFLTLGLLAIIWRMRILEHRWRAKQAARQPRRVRIVDAVPLSAAPLQAASELIAEYGLTGARRMAEQYIDSDGDRRLFWVDVRQALHDGQASGSFR